METRRDVFQAISDPTRRAIIDIIAKDALTVNAIAENFSISRQAISLQVQLLSECGLIVIRKKGRQRFCEAKLEKLNEISAWLEPHRRFYEATADHLESYLKKLKKKNKHRHEKRKSKK